ncbi:MULTISPECIES: dipeptide/oligopeptide/nickel ABC transporter permease/ATP-binding protein [Streptomyces]|uniref:Dipeptide/oligopeptide/nickel ABC transporter permease/ATP-binding protein n=1 Tax=Streptomyces caniscabiei TaxID=2746961 RepID=A0ABU4MYC0_9ACTN|nr:MULTISPECIES: dipeptide/oligopeptide/nickel ABC transporter permease/ATP-binding protein [Streptomyces]MBE4740838.1 dipeptide/oligopeptide/nickel ABC transporter permease/ATP-binding protein [Streptomyces caniscabiei]MBE4760608.1 dipeptide/oligopeptide/nickel ABC transporter permease/ATP-binding protein [Streptomyces caniscabiei]MBE4774606.1 dipeptide/oligopeptide/nickel ABC transporter permease/ATP-binding protein [Streptomyces caniscabiei]MBE4788973.1 dipeptide/oligopeptide/nickel ABC tran
MTAPDLAVPDAGTAAASVASAERSLFVRLLRNPQAAICLAFVVLIAFVAIFAPLLAPYSATYTDLEAVGAPAFSTGHVLGGDAAGRDVLSRLIWGTRQSGLASLIVLGVSLAVGAVSGLVAGFYRGRFETVSGFATDVVMSLPGVVLLIALYSLTGPDIPVAMAVFGLLVAPGYYRLVRGVVLGVRGELYVDAARVVGLSDLRIVGRHVLWAVRVPIVIQSSFVLAAGIGIEAGVTFLGLGDSNAGSWGVVLQKAFEDVYNNPLGIVWPALLISVTILALILLGNALSDVLQASARSKPVTARQRKVALAVGTTDVGEPADDALLSLRGIRIAYPQGDEIREVVHGVDLDVRRGEIHGLVGESGSGKSQIVFSVLGILPREALTLAGSVHLDGVDLLADEGRMRAARGRRIAYVPQEPMSNLDPCFTIGRQLLYWLRASTDLGIEEARERIVALLTRVGIQDPERVMGLYPHQISGGMAQRVLICGAVASDPDVIVADEPTTALDVTVQAEVLELMRELARERGLAMIIVTHNLGVVADLCDTVSVMKDGWIVEQAAVDDLFESPREPYTKELLSASRRVELMETETS